MRYKSLLGISALTFLCCRFAVAEDPTVQLCEPWASAYAGDDATGNHVIACWQFNPGAETQDDSGHGHPIKLRGAKFSPDGKFDACLESFRGWPVEDKPHSASADNHSDLSPQGGFTLELWLKPKPEFADYPTVFLLDKKYVADDDYQITISKADRNGSRRIHANLGFGIDSETYTSEPLKIEVGTWYHLAFTYDGAGTGSFYVNGRSWGTARRSGRKSITHGKHHLVIGDRVGSYYHGFPGYLDQVRICRGVREFRHARFEQLSDRTSFRRMEPDVTLRFALTNLMRSPTSEATAVLSLEGMAEKQIKLPGMESGRSRTLDYPLDTRLRPNTYQLHAHLRWPGNESADTRESFPVTIVARRPPHRFPVLMWGLYGPQNVHNEIDRLKRIGFTHVLGLSADCGKIWDEKKTTLAANPSIVRQTKQMLNEALARDVAIVASLSPGSHLRSKAEFLRINRQRKPYKREGICGLFPGMREFCYNVGASIAQTYGRFPAFEGALIHTEVRDSAQVCFHEHDRAACREHTGADIPDEVTIKNGVQYGHLKNFPASRVIPDDNPILRYYRWYWKTGDGWNALNSAVHEGLQTAGLNDFWTFNDPAVRVASTYGSGGAVDTLSHWTYTYPDPVRIGLCTDELLAMAAGADHKQNVMKMTQIIWYRSQTAPMPKPDAATPAHKARWEIQQPGAPFITIAPMHLREALWTKIARPIRGIMYHGWQSLVSTDATGGYRFTHPQTQHELARLIREVVEPLGPTLLNVPGIRSDVALLESFTSQMFARRGTYGWGGSWLADAYHVLQYAHLQPQIIYDETIIQHGLDGFRVLVLADCDVLTRSLADKIKAFQAGGGLVVADEHVAPAIQPDIRIKVYTRTAKAADDKAALIDRAAKLRKQLDSRYRRPVDTSNPDVIPYLRRYKNADYIFLVNDRREAGDYVGHHGRVLENGLPATAVLSLNRKDGFVYDLVTGRPIKAVTKKNQMDVNVRLGPCDGKLLMVTAQPIDRITIKTPEHIVRGASATCTIEVLDPNGRPLEAVLPVTVHIRDPETRPAEFSGHYAAVDGKLRIPLDIAPNDPEGIWQITARQGASGRQATHYLRVTSPESDGK